MDDILLPTTNEASRNSQVYNPSACEQCQLRKTKCDRGTPCIKCLQTASTCSRTPPVRRPRGRQGGRRKDEYRHLHERIIELEDLLRWHNGDGQSRQACNNVGQHPAESSTDRTGSIASTTSHSFEPTPYGPSNLLFGKTYSSSNTTNIVPEPSDKQMETLLDVFVKQVDPVVKILHVPSLQRYYIGHVDELHCSPGKGGLPALRASICYAAVTTMSEEQCSARLVDTRAKLCERFREAVERQMILGNVVNTNDMSTLQALVIFLVALRSNDSSRLSWTLTGLAVRLAQALGLHREERNAPFWPFMAEMRRRLWWAICVIDFIAAADRGTDRVIGFQSFDTRLPLHINDADIDPTTTKLPDERLEFTGMTFSLVTYEIFPYIRYLNNTSTSAENEQHALNESKSRRNRDRDIILQCRRHLEDKYLRYCDANHTLHATTAMVADVTTSMLWLMLYRPLHKRSDDSYPHDVPYPGLLKMSLDVVEKYLEILSDPQSASYVWYSRVFVQWHPLAILLSELSLPGSEPSTARAWSVAQEASMVMKSLIADGSDGSLWQLIEKLMNAARCAARLRQPPRSPQQKLYKSTGAHTIMQDTNAMSALATVDLSDTTRATSNFNMPFNWMDEAFVDILHDDQLGWESWDTFLDTVYMDTGSA